MSIKQSKKISGTGTLDVPRAKKFINSLPENVSVLDVEKDQEVPGEFGSPQWHLTATWDEEEE